MLDLLLIMSLGFLGSFGHCAGMCGPITAAFSLTQQQSTAQQQSITQPQSTAQQQSTTQPQAVKPTGWQQFAFHILLNVGRILSYALVGAGIGMLGSVLVAGGQMAGVGSNLRYCMSLLTGLLLIWFGLSQISPGLLPRLPFLHPLMQGNLHNRLSSAMVNLSLRSHWWTPFLLGIVWGMVPCGFLYTAQIKAAETGNLWRGSAMMLAFGLGTLPIMLGVGVSTALVSSDRRSQLYRLGGWITLIIGVLTLLRTGDTMVDYTGHTALICLVLALIARPISRLWGAPLRYRRVLGVGAFVLSVAHTAHMVEHTWGWNLQALFFMLPQHQWAIAAGAIALMLMLPAALTSVDRAQRWLGKRWRTIHLLTLPALIFSAVHCILIGSHYLGRLQLTWQNWLQTVVLSAVVLAVLLVRSRRIWSLLSLEKLYAPAQTK